MIVPLASGAVLSRLPLLEGALATIAAVTALPTVVTVVTAANVASLDRVSTTRSVPQIVLEATAGDARSHFLQARPALDGKSPGSASLESPPGDVLLQVGDFILFFFGNCTDSWWCSQ